MFPAVFFLGKGIPLKRAEQRRYEHVPDALLPTVEQAVQLYLQSGANKTLTMESKFGEDPLVTEHQKEIRMNMFEQKFTRIENIFSSIVAGEIEPFRGALLFFIRVTEELANGNVHI